MSTLRRPGILFLCIGLGLILVGGTGDGWIATDQALGLHLRDAARMFGDSSLDDLGNARTFAIATSFVGVTTLATLIAGVIALVGALGAAPPRRAAALACSWIAIGHAVAVVGVVLTIIALHLTPNAFIALPFGGVVFTVLGALALPSAAPAAPRG
ncbi:MAG: hypothetical protein K8W52_33895 [Deltaproteobacteria bacterium]|nr:hypothetical protein [Deltaproteobacteria bacterium]